MGTKHGTRIEKPCNSCGALMALKPSKSDTKYCSTECQYKGKLKAPLAYCKGCNKEFRSLISGGQRMQYCTIQCVRNKSKRVTAEAKVLRLWAKRNRDLSTKTCRVCGSTAVREKIECCKEHAKQFRKTDNAFRYKKWKSSQVVQNKFCNQCGCMFIPEHLSTKYCSSVCARKNHRKTCPSRHKRKAIIRGANGASSFSPFVVFDRDNWKCRICGIDTPKSLRGSCAHNSPELDHIIPLSKAGTHSISNTQCLCRSCNALKSDKLMSEVLELLES